MIPTRAEAWELLTQYTQSESLLKHALCVEAAMRTYADKYNEDVELWGVTGLLHDFDYEKYPDPEQGGHPYKGNEILKELGYDESITTTIMGHATFTGVARETKMAKTLFAVDELCGFIMAVAYVRPDGLERLKPKSIKKKLKDKGFAAGVSREDVRLGVEELGAELDEHIEIVISALQGIKSQLGVS